MSELDRTYDEREAKRAAAERERLERVAAASGFLAEFHEKDVAPSKALAKHGLSAQLADNRILIHRAAAGIHADALQITVGEQGEIDVAGRSLGRFTADDHVKLKREIVAEILTFFDL